MSGAISTITPAKMVRRVLEEYPLEAYMQIQRGRSVGSGVQ
jgi:hypothetical protein